MLLSKLTSEVNWSIPVSTAIIMTTIMERAMSTTMQKADAAAAEAEMLPAAADARDAVNLCICLNQKIQERRSEYITRALIMTENSSTLHMTAASHSSLSVLQA